MNSLLSSRLYDQNTFYEAFLHDLNKCEADVIIESPFITVKRTTFLKPTLEKLVGRGVRVIVTTREPKEDDRYNETITALAMLHELGVEILLTGNHHRKLAIIDRRVLYEGSLNILSQHDSCEIMRRIESEEIGLQMLVFTGVVHSTYYLRGGYCAI